MNLKRVSFSQGHGQEVAGTDPVDAGTRTGCGRCRTWGTAGNGDAVGTWAGCEAGVGHGVLQDMGCCRDKGRMWPVQEMECCRTWGCCRRWGAAGHRVLQDMGCCRDKGRMWPELDMGVLQTSLPWSAIISTARTAHWWREHFRCEHW